MQLPKNWKLHLIVKKCHRGKMILNYVLGVSTLVSVFLLSLYLPTVDLYGKVTIISVIVVLISLSYSRAVMYDNRKKTVEVLVSQDGNIWVNVDGKCQLRVYDTESIRIEDNRHAMPDTRLQEREDSGTL